MSNPPEFLKDSMNLAQAFSNTKMKIHHEHDKMVKKILENKKEAADFINKFIFSQCFHDKKVTFWYD